MKKLFLDFETLYTDEYSLRKMTPLEYILHPSFELLGCAFSKEDDDFSYWIDGPKVADHLRGFDPAQTMAISHNAVFDMSILKLRLNFSPVRYGCTMSMAANWIRHQSNRVSLGACCEHYGFGSKMDTILRMKGVNFHALEENWALHGEVMVYGKDDVSKCRKLFEQMMLDGFPVGELDVIDMVVKMAVNPRFELDAMVLAEHLGEVLARKQALLDRVQMETRDNLLKDAAFAAMLNAEGVKAPMKVSKTTGREIFAFAKTDREFTALLEHENEEVQALVAARLGHKSTLEETRTRRFLKISALTKSMPVPLRYSGAHTHRFSGDWALNMQNLPRGSKLRNALRAPKGQLVVSVDASQIEARINAWLSEQQDLLDAFRAGRDVYSEFASLIYNRTVTKADKRERTVGKVAILSLGYGSSALVFQNMLRNQGNVIVSEFEASAIVHLYRNTYPKIVDNWKHADRVLLPIIAGSYLNADRASWGPLEIIRHAIVLPNGNYLHYRNLGYAQTQDNLSRWTFHRGDQMLTVYGAKLVENVTQALAFVHIMEVARRVQQMTKGLLVPAHQVHDELIYVVPAHNAEKVALVVQREMSKTPWWGEGLPLAAEANVGPSYGEIK